MKGRSKTKLLHLPAELQVAPSRIVAVEHLDASVATYLVLERQQRTQDGGRALRFEALKARPLAPGPIRSVRILEKSDPLPADSFKRSCQVSFLPAAGSVNAIVAYQDRWRANRIGADRCVSPSDITRSRNGKHDRCRRSTKRMLMANRKTVHPVSGRRKSSMPEHRRFAPRSGLPTDR